MSSLVRALALLAVLCAAHACLPNERQMLHSMFSSTQGLQWHNSSGWLTNDPDCCSWFGITCAPGSGAVTALKLRANNVVGPFPNDIAQLGQLETLDLYANFISGSIPESIGLLPNLSALRLGGRIPDPSSLSGSLPQSLATLPRLSEVLIAWTSISGAIPSGLGSQSQLSYLSLIGNHLIGSIPETIGMSRGLSLLDLSFNKLSGAVPASLAALAQLHYISLSNNQLEAIAPSLIAPTPVWPALQIANSCYLQTNAFACPLPQWALQCQMPCPASGCLPMCH